jgi:hypothetical protein
VLSRLARARDRLRGRPGVRGLAPEVVWPVVASANHPAWGAPVPAALACATIRAATSLALAEAAQETVVPATVAGLSRGVARALTFSRIRLALGPVLLAAACLAIGLAATLPHDDPGREPPQPRSEPAGAQTSQVPAPPKAGQRPADRFQSIRGRVLDPEGKPVAGATILLGIPTSEEAAFGLPGGDPKAAHDH